MLPHCGEYLDVFVHDLCSLIIFILTTKFIGVIFMPYRRICRAGPSLAASIGRIEMRKALTLAAILVASTANIALAQGKLIAVS